MNNQDELIARLFKDTLIIFLLLMFVSTIGYVIDGIITGEFLGVRLDNALSKIRDDFSGGSRARNASHVQ